MNIPLIRRVLPYGDALPMRQRSTGGNWALSVVGSATFALLLYASAVQLQGGQSPPAAAPPAVPQPNWQADFPDRIARVTEALQHLPLPLPTPIEESQGAGALRWVQRRYELTLPQVHDFAAIEQLFDPVRAAARGVTLQATQDAHGAHVQIGVDYLLTHNLTLHWLDRKPRIAVIVDQLGDDLLVPRALAGMEQPVTFAVKPYRPFSKEVAELAKLFGREVLLQVGAEPNHPAGRDPADRDELARELGKQLASVPYAVGLENMDSGWLDGALLSIMDVLRQKAFFLIAGAPAADPTPCALAARSSVACAAPSDSLAATDDPAALEAQIEKLLSAARTRGDGILVVHPQLTALPALQKSLPRFAEVGIDVVPASTLVREQGRRGQPAGGSRPDGPP